MTKFDLDPDHSGLRDDAPTTAPRPGGGRCDLYSPGHQLHYRHQGMAVRSQARLVHRALVDGTELTLLLSDGAELHWRHHDPDRLRRILELVPSKRVAYPDAHALRVGPYWFNCATEHDHWVECGPFPGPDGR